MHPQVECWTSNEPAAGTKAPITLRMRGDKGTSDPILLDNDPNNFTRGRHDTFEVLALPLGPLREIDIGHDKGGAEFAWHLDRVEVTPEGSSKPYVFHAGEGGVPGVGAWFSSEVGHKLRRLLPVANGDLAMVKYQVLVQTGSHKYAGTEASVRITLYGVDKATGKETRSREDIRLENGRDNFTKGKLDKFVLAPMLDLGDIKKIRIGHDNSGAAPGWQLDCVEVRRPRKHARLMICLLRNVRRGMCS